MFKTRHEYIAVLKQMFIDNAHKLKPVFGVDLWPVMHIKTGYYFHQLFNKQPEGLGNTPAYQKDNFAIRLKDILSLVKAALLLFVSKGKFLNRCSGNPLFVGFDQHVDIEGNNIYITQATNFLKQQGISFNTIDINTPETSIEPGSTEYLYKLLERYYTIKLKVWYALNSHHKQENQKAFDNSKVLSSWLAAYLNETDHIGSELYIAGLFNHRYYLIWLRFLSITKPKKIWTYCYYDKNILALSRAAARLNIPVVEYQHSLQDDNHFAYCKWDEIDNYSSFFPAAYWLWRASDAERIEKNFSGLKYQPQIIKGGNIYLAQTKQNIYKPAADRDKNVLICLQGQWIPAFLEDFISRDENFKWFIRLHPRYPEDKPKLDVLKNNFPDKIEVEAANLLTLYELFNLVKYNVTAFSGTALEASAWDIENIIFSEEGYSSYKHYIDRDEFAFVANANDLTEALYRDKVTSDTADPIITDNRVVYNELSKLFVE